MITRRSLLKSALALPLLTLPLPAYSVTPTDYPFRAKPDGTTDNSQAIQDAIDSVLQKGGGYVRFDVPGTYLCDDQITIPSGAKDLICDGGGSYLKAGPSVDTDFFKIGRRDYADGQVESLVFQNMRWRGQGSTDTSTSNANGVSLGNCLNVTFRDCSIHSFAGRGFVGDKPGSAAGGVTRRWENVAFDRLGIRYTGKQNLDIGREYGTVDTLDMYSCLFNNGGKRVTQENGSAGVYVQAVHLNGYGGQVSGMRNDDNVSGYISAMLIRKAMGELRGYHFEQNCNAQSQSRDLYLEDCDGYEIGGLLHSAMATTSAEMGVRIDAKDVKVGAIRAEGGSSHTLRWLLDHHILTNNLPIFDLDALTADSYGLVKGKVWANGVAY